MFSWKSVVIIGSLTAFILWIIKNNPEYDELFKNPRETWFEMSWKRNLAISVFILAGFFFLAQFFENFLTFLLHSLATNPAQTFQGQMTRRVIGPEGSHLGLVLLGLTFAGVGIGEEVVFRGVILHFVDKHRSTIVAVLVSSVLWGMLHLSEVGFNYVMFIHTFFMGLVLGVIYKKFGLISSSVTHAGYNFLLILSLLI